MLHPTMGFENLHKHSDFSLLDGFGTVAEYAERMKEINQQYLAITDHGVMGAIPQQIAECDARKLYPLFGCELYVNPMQPKVNSRAESAEVRKALGTEEEQKKFDKSNHLLAIAYNNVGYSNLVRLTSWAWIHGYYRRPRVNHEVLQQYKEGIIFTSTCANSEIAQAFLKYGEEAGYVMLEKYMAMFGEHFYLELMMLDFKDQKPYDAFLVRAHDKYHVPLIMTTDCHYCRQQESHNQRLMLLQKSKYTLAAIEELKRSGEAEDLFELQDTNLWLKSEEELNTKWESDYKDVIDYELYKQSKANTVKLAEFAKGVQIDRNIKLPKIPDADAVLWEEIKRGFVARHCPKTPQYAKRVREEYDLIMEKGFSSYFLIQKMMTDEARKIAPEIIGFGDGSEAVGPGRGCLHPLTPIRLDNGSVVPICKVKADDSVFTINGEAKKVKKTVSYPLFNETLLRIKTYYGDYFGVPLTHDHEVYAEKQVRPKGWSTWAESTRKSRKTCEEPTGICEWISAGNLSVGDWCFVPIPSVKMWSDFKYDLSEFSGRTYLNGKKLTFDDDFVYHEYNAKSGGRKMRCSERYWSMSLDWAFVLGVFVGDGWTRSKQMGQVGFCANHNESHLDDICEVFEQFGVDSSLIEKQNSKEVDQLIVKSVYMEMLFDSLHPNYMHTAQTKHVPEFILRAPLAIVERYLTGYFMADGHEDDNKMKFETVSPILAEQIRFLLLRLGIPSSLGFDDRIDQREEFANRQPSYIITCPLDKRIGASRDAECRYGWRRVKNGIMLRIREICEEQGPDYVCDLEIDGNHNYLTSSFLVHNSVCGSLVAYCLRLHDVEPIIHDLRFSRFLSPARGGKQMKIRHSIKPIPHQDVAA